MSVRSAIGYINTEGMCSSVYCHWAGSPKHQLPILREHYTTIEDVKALIEPGSMSCLRTTTDWEDRTRAPQPLYHAERDINDVEPIYTGWQIASNKRHWKLSYCEHLYIFDQSTSSWTHFKL